MEEKIRNLIEGEVLKLGVSIDSVENVKEGQYYYLKIVIDRDEPIDLDKCVEVTNVINPLLDDIDFIDESYTLDITTKEKGGYNE